MSLTLFDTALIPYIAPRIINLEHDVVLPDHCAKARKNASNKPNCLHHHCIASTCQENPLVPQPIWEFFPSFYLLKSNMGGPSIYVNKVVGTPWVGHYFGIEFVHKEHLYTRAISPFKSVTAIN